MIDLMVQVEWTELKIDKKKTFKINESIMKQNIFFSQLKSDWW